MNSFLEEGEDVQIGYWVTNDPYYINGTLERTYIYPPGFDITKYQDPEIRKLFDVNISSGRIIERAKVEHETKTIKEVTINDPMRLFMEGRLWWFGEVKEEPSDNHDRVLVGTPKKLSPASRKLFELGKLENIDISSLVCGFPPGVFIETLKGECTTYGRKIATSLIKTAATRIFADPMQAFMEPISNSFDSYFPDRRIGKFGMGFFSLLYWIFPPRDLTNPNPDSRIEILSFTSSGVYEACLIYTQESGVTLKYFKILKDSKVTSTGSKVTIYPQKPFTSKEAISIYVARFRFLAGCKIVYHHLSDDEFSSSGIVEIIQNDKSKNKFVGISASLDRVIFEDYAEGILEKIFFSSLLIPSVSTKGIDSKDTSPRKPILPSRSFNISGKESILSITISDLVVVELKLVNPNSSVQTQYVISLPSDTRVIVSRDDFIITREISKIIEVSLVNLALKEKDITVLELLVDKYMSTTVNPINRQAFEQAMKKIYSLIKLSVPSQYLLSIYRNLDENVIGSLTYSTLALEKWLSTIYQNSDFRGDKIWLSTIVLRYPEEDIKKITFAGTNSFLFIPSKLILQPDWISIVKASFTEARLYGYDEIGDVSADRYKLREHSKDISDEELRLAETCIYSALALSLFYQIFPKSIPKNIDFAVYEITKRNKTEYHSLMTALNHRIRTMEAYFEYGNGKPLLNNSSNLSFHEGFLALETEYFIWACQNYPKRERLFPPQYHPTADLYEKDYRGFMAKELLKYTNNFRTHIVAFALLEHITDRPDEVAKIAKSLVRDLEAITKIFSHVGFLCEPNLFKYSLPFASFNVLVQKYKNQLLDFPTARSTFSKLELPDPVKSYEFTTSNLINWIFKKEYFGMDYYNLVRSVPEEEKVRLQILSIAVNEATSKSVEDAICAETFQNSMDAMRANPNVPQKLEMFLDVKETINGYEVVYEILDHVGMTEEQFFHLGIPFLSSKAANAVQTGEMGTGFFNVYRRSSKVVILTCKNDKLIKSVDVPLRSSTGKVTDISRTVTVYPADSWIWTSFKSIMGKSYIPKGTSISVYDVFPTKEEAMEVLSSYQSFILNNLRPSPISFDFYLNNIEIKKHHTELVFDNQFYSIRWNEEGDFLPMVCTKGIPLATLFSFSDLEKFPRLDLLYGIIVDLKDEAYTPVHSRSKINLDPRVESIIANCLFLASLRHQTYKYPSWSHTTSESDMRQLTFGKGKTYAPTEYWQNIDRYGSFIYYPFSFTRNPVEVSKKWLENTDRYSVAYIIDSVVEKTKTYEGTKVSNAFNKIAGLVEKDFPTRWLNEEEQTILDIVKPIYDSSIEKYLLVIILKRVAEWFEPKKPNERRPRNNNETKNQKAKPELEKFIKVFSEEYCKLLQTNFKISKPTPEIKVLTEDFPTVLGSYSKFRNRLMIVIDTRKEKEALQAVKLFRESSDPNKVYCSDQLIDNEWWSEYVYDADATISHELEHYRRNDDHDLGGHSDITDELFEVKGIKNFPTACLIVKKNLILQGLLANVWKRLK